MNTDAYIISLNPPNELIEYTKKFNLNPIWVEGVNGKEISDEDIRKHNSELWSFIGPKGAIGCGMSHLLCWERIAKSDKDYSIVLEDDVYFLDDFEEQLANAIQNVPYDFDILYLGCHSCEKNSLQSKFFSLVGKNRKYKDINDHIEVPKLTLATHAYVVSKKGARNLLDLLDGNVSFHIDQELQNLSRKNKIKVYAVKKRSAFQTSTLRDSTSNNVTTEHPILINYPLSYVVIDNDMSLKYALNVSIASLSNDVNINAMSLLFLFTGFILAYNKIRPQIAFASFLVLSMPDMCTCFKQVLFHLILFMLPFAIFH